MEKITMSKKSTLTINDAFELFIRKCKIKNLTDLSISSYEKKMVHFYEFIDKNEPITTVTKDTVDDYILWLRENTEANDITINSYLRSVRAFLYYCMECNYIPTFKISLIKAEKKIKETYTDDELARLLTKPDINTCSFSCYKTWVFENYLLGTGNRISTALDLHIGDINFQSATIMGNYISFIEHFTDVYTSITYWDVYYPNYVEHWNNEGGEEHLVSTDRSVGLPIHYHNFNDEDYNFGISLLNDIRPILDDLEDIISKMGTSIYVNTLNPMPVAIGQRIESSIPADATGYVLNLDVGDFKYASCNMDYNTIKLYLDNLKQFLNDVACIPSVLGSNTNISNISEVSMQILLMMASVYADENKKWLNIGFNERFNMFKKILNMQGIKVDGDVDVIYNVSMPIASTEMIANLKALQEMGAISRETIMEKSEYITDVDVEKKRLQGENVAEPKVSEVPKDKEDKENP